MTKRTKREILESYYQKARFYDQQEEMEFHLKALSDFEIFFRHVIGHSVGDYHHKLFRILKNDRVCLMSPRGHAKTEICSVCYVLWRALNKENQEIVIVSSAEQQSTRIIRRIKNYMDENEYFHEVKPNYTNATWSKSVITLTNGTRITSSPFTDTIRGNRIDLCVCDDILKRELSDQSPAITKFFEIIEPAVDNPGSQLIVVGTPQSEHDLLHRLGEEGSGYAFKKFQCCGGMDGNRLKGPVLFPERWTLKKLQERFVNMGLAAFMQEYMTTPIQPGDIIFDYFTTIKPNIDENLSEMTAGVAGRTYWLGVDIALSTDRAADFSAYVVLEKRPGDSTLRVVRVERPAKGTYTDLQFERIKELHNSFNFTQILIENKGNSMSLVDALKHDPFTAGVTRDFPTTHTEKERIIMKLQKQLATSNVNFYPCSELLNELKDMGIKHQIRAGRSYERIESLTGHDDTVIAFALAVEAATSPKGQVGALWV